MTFAYPLMKTSRVWRRICNTRSVKGLCGHITTTKSMCFPWWTSDMSRIHRFWVLCYRLCTLVCCMSDWCRCWACVSVSHTLRGGLCCSWVLRLRPLLFSWSCFHLAVLEGPLCWVWEPLFPWLGCALWVSGALWTFCMVWVSGLMLWLSVLTVLPGTWLLCKPVDFGIIWAGGLFGTLGVFCTLCVGFCKLWGVSSDFAPTPAMGLTLGVFFPFGFFSRFQMRSQNSSTLLRSGCSRRLMKSRYQSLCLGEGSLLLAPARSSSSPTRWDGMTWRLIRRRGWMKPCSTAWQWYTPESAWVRLRISRPWPVRLSLSSITIWHGEKQIEFINTFHRFWPQRWSQTKT